MYTRVRTVPNAPRPVPMPPANGSSHSQFVWYDSVDNPFGAETRGRHDLSLQIDENIHFWAATDVGRVRDHNEDNFLVDKALNLFVVADGMGGHAAGEVASAVAVQTLRDVVSRNKDLIDAYREGSQIASSRDITSLLEHAVQKACAEIYTKAQDDPEKRGMGTTLSALLVINNRGFIAHVGDSRIYLLRGGRVVQLTEDHSLVNELIKRGKLTEAQAETSPYKNAVTRAVGVYESVEVDTIDFDVLPGDQFLLASDGLTGSTEGDFTHPILRGLWVLGTVMCKPPGEPPEGIPSLSEEMSTVERISGVAPRSVKWTAEAGSSSYVNS